MITRTEAADVLRRIARGQIDISAVGRSWNEVYAGNVEFMTCDGWNLVVFNDCDDFDYLDSITAPDGRTGCFDDWWPDGEDGYCPYDTLDQADRHNLEHLCRNALVADAAPTQEQPTCAN